MIIPPIWGIYKCLQVSWYIYDADTMITWPLWLHLRVPLERSWDPLPGGIPCPSPGRHRIHHVSHDSAVRIHDKSPSHSRLPKALTYNKYKYIQYIIIYSNNGISKDRGRTLIAIILTTFSGTQCSFWMKFPWCGAAVPLSIASTWCIPGENPMCRLMWS